MVICVSLTQTLSKVRIENLSSGLRVVNSGVVTPNDVLGLHFHANDPVRVQARGEDASKVVEEIAAIIGASSFPLSTIHRTSGYKDHVAATVKMVRGHAAYLTPEQLLAFEPELVCFLKQRKNKR